MGAIASHLWQSTLVVAVAAALTWFLRNNSASVRFWIWFAASAKFLVPFAAISAVASGLPWPEPAALGNAAVGAVSRVFEASAVPTISPISFSAIVVLWLAGTAVVTARWLGEWNRAVAIAREAEPMNDGPVFDSLRRLERELGIRRPLAIVCSSDDVEPGIVGIRTPILVWPQHLSAGLRHDQIEPLLAHELAHVVRRDNLFASAHMLATAAFWFHPVVWWIGTRLIEERERACDEQVLALGQSPATYAAGILKTCELCIASPLANVPGVTGGHLKKRIERIVEKRVGEPLDFIGRTAVALVVLVAIALPVTAGAWAQQKPAPIDHRGADAERSEPSLDMPKLSREAEPQYRVRAVSDDMDDQVRMECVVKTDQKPSDFRMECVVRTDGEPSDIRIVQSVNPHLDRAPIDAVRQSDLGPGKRRNTPVPVMMTVGIAFTLK
jgi:beta-lactamase regulating signal transducer with metallopeptidase domain